LLTRSLSAPIPAPSIPPKVLALVAVAGCLLVAGRHDAQSKSTREPQADHEINVFFLKDGKVRVEPDLSGVHTGESVIWKMHSTNNQVTWAQIEFQDPRAGFFNGGAKSSIQLNYGHAYILGNGPSLGLPGTLEGKFWVRGYSADPDRGGMMVAQLDPTIITCDP